MYQRNLKAYKATSVAADLAVADPHRVIQLMMQGVLELVIWKQNLPLYRKLRGYYMVCRMHLI